MKTYRYVCKVCGKVIESQYKRQAVVNAYHHVKYKHNPNITIEEIEKEIETINT